MAIEIKVPVLAESVAEATLMKWHKKIGDNVHRGDSLIDIETDKVTLEVAAPHDGLLAEILKQDGETVTSNEVIARIEPGIAKIPAVEKQPQVTPAAQPEQRPLAMEQAPKKPEPKLSPAVRNLIQQYKLDAAEIKSGTGQDRITKEDVMKHIEQRNVVQPEKPAPVTASAPAPAPATTPAPVLAPKPEPEKSAMSFQQTTQKTKVAPAPVAVESRPEQRVPMTRLRKRIAERLLGAQHENAILTTFNEVNMQPVINLRNRYKEEFEKAHGVKLGFMSFFTRAAVEALKKFPIINASVDGDDIVYHSYYDIGIAVSSPRGLVVPIVRDADTMSFAAIETRIREFGDKARDGKLTIAELSGGTFTITNGGVFGSLLSTPILNPPQSAILGMHKMQDRPVAENGAVVIRPMMYLALSYDHRIIDGREAVQFLVAIKEQLEDPARLLLQV
ncbi:MAG: 2-oxoglutarate dehydrogenase complex dihydrolipoyllysine-residue succinyltransferase [Gammaproteobacteria bacterium]